MLLSDKIHGVITAVLSSSYTEGVQHRNDALAEFLSAVRSADSFSAHVVTVAEILNRRIIAALMNPSFVNCFPT